MKNFNYHLINLLLIATSVVVVAHANDVKTYRENRKQTVKNILLEHSKEASTNCYHSWIGDKSCDKACDNKENNFDGGDCLPHFQQVHSTEKVEQQAGFDVQVIGFTTSESTREEHHVYDVPFTTVRRLQKFQLRPRDNNPKFKIVMMQVSTDYEKAQLKVHQDGQGNLFVDAIPANVAVGINEVLFVTSNNDKIDGGQIVVLFNPWAVTSPVHMKPYKGTDYLEEFILELTGQSYYGDASSGVESIGTKRNFFGTKTWGYHHDDVAVQEVVLKLLNVLGSLDRKDPRKVSRHFTKVLSATWNGNGYQGMLSGRWDGKYDDGAKPTSWTGSRDIYRQYLNNGMRSSVKYGQCWVFGGILTTALRYLGIPSRIVVNFRSAHDTGDFDHVIIAKKESVWNFHVWVDAWMKRDDIHMPGYDSSMLVGWNAVDATPQEKSDGEYQMGPAFIPFIKSNFGFKAENQFDAKFVASEVNAVHRFPKADYRQDVGRAMLTKKSFVMQPINIMKRYKKCKSIFYAVLDKGKTCGFHIANGKRGYVYDDNGGHFEYYTRYGGEIVKIRVLSLVSTFKAKVCDASNCDNNKGVVNLNQIFSAENEVSSFLETSWFGFGKKKKDEVEEKDVEPEIVKDLPDGTKKSSGIKETHKLPQEEEPEDEEEKEKEEEEEYVQKETEPKKKKKGLLRGMWSKTKNFAKGAYKKTKEVVKKVYVKFKRFLVSVVTTINPLRHLSKKMFVRNKKLCSNCFEISKVHPKSYVKNPFKIRIKRNLKHQKDLDFKVNVVFEVVSNNGQDVERGKPFYKIQKKFKKGQKEHVITLAKKLYHEHLDKAMSIRVTLRALSDDNKYIDFDQQTIQLHVEKLEVSNINSVKDAQNREVLTFDVSIKNPLSMPLENVKLSIDEPYGDRTQKVGKLDVGAVLKKSIKVPIVKKKWSKKVNQRCVIVSAYANELFAMSGWENTVCYDEAKSKEKVKGIKVVLAKWKGLSKKK